jgi:programmed cell death 6-interacting protein
MFKAIAHYEDSRDMCTEELFGQQIGRLRTAYSLLIACQTAKLTKNVPEMAEFFTLNLSKIQMALVKAEKDNDEIYHDMVIPESKLKPLEKKSMVKSMPLEREKFALIVDPFVNLVPTGARKADSLYCEKRAEVLREITKEMEQQNDTAKGALTALGLPGAIEAMETPIGIPSSLLERLRVVKLEGGVNFLREQLKLLDKLAQQAQLALSESTKLLDEEEREDNDLRNQYKNKWNRTPSHMLTDQLRGEAQKHQGNLDHARKSDRFIASKLESGAEFLQRLSWEKEQISGLLPTADLLSGTTPTLNVSVLKERLSQLDTLLFEREQKLTQLKELSTKDDILDKIIRTPENEFEALFNQELQKYSHLTTQIRGTFTTQASLLIDITNENQKLVEQRKSNMDLARRQEVLSQFDNAFSIYTQLKFHLTEGAQFYVDFQEALKKFRSKCQDFIFARRTEKDDLFGDIKAQEATSQIQSQNQSTNAASSLGNSSMSHSTPLSSSSVSQPPQQSQPTSHMPVYYHAPGSQAPPPYPAPVGVAPSGPFSVPMSMLQQPTPQQQPQQMMYGQYHYAAQPAYYMANPYMMQQQQQQPPQYQPPRK